MTLASDDPETIEFLRSFGDGLRFLFITSGVEFGDPAPDAFRASEIPGFTVGVEPARGTKCERCWNFTEDVGRDADWPQVCARCSAAVRKILSEADPA